MLTGVWATAGLELSSPSEKEYLVRGLRLLLDNQGARPIAMISATMPSMCS